MYKLCPDHSIFGKTDSIIRTTDGACIPFDPANTDYQAFLKYQAEGGVVLPADEQGEAS